MKYVYVALVLVLVGGGYFFVTSQVKAPEKTTEVPEGFHRMEDGTLMKNTPDATDEMNTGVQESASLETGTGVVGETSINATPSTQQPQASVTIDPNARVFAVTGINYGYDVKEITVKKGDTVTINFESTDGFHDWVIDEFDAKTSKVQPGVPTSVTFVADKAGTFEYYCSVGSHRMHGMVGKLIVQE